MNIMEQHASVLAEMKSIVDRATEPAFDGRSGTKSRDLTAAESQRIEELSVTAENLARNIKAAEADSELANIMNSLAANDTTETYLGNQHPQGSAASLLMAGGVKRLALTGTAGRKSATELANRFARSGAKSLVSAGATVATVPMAPESIAQGIIPTSVLEALPLVLRDTPTYRYLRQIVRTNNAAIVPRGETKPTSVVTVEPVDGELQVIAHLSEYIHEYDLKDSTSLQQFIATQLFFMLREALEAEVLTGDGTPGHFRGLLNTSGVQTQAYATDAVTTLRLAALKLENVGQTADLFIVNSTDWATIETQRATSGAFDLGGPIDRAAQKLWSTQVVTSTRIPAGTALALDQTAVGLDTDGNIEIKWDQASGFDKNQVRARVEGRFGLSVFQPAGIAKATISE